jgi:predicted AAA+ superfamily ATPase
MQVLLYKVSPLARLTSYGSKALLDQSVRSGLEAAIRDLAVRGSASRQDFLTQSLGDVEYFDCELPRVRRMIDDPEGFLQDNRGRRIVLDEIHRLERPSEILKIAADHFPDTRILATGSSTLGASAKFRDTLAGRKEELWLTPMTTDDLEDFGGTDLHHRLLHGGLPPFFLAKVLPEKDFQEWMDAYWAKDIQELFRLERRQSLKKFAELLMAQSGGG